MSVPGDAPLPDLVIVDEDLPGVEVISGDPPKAWAEAFEVGLKDLRAGRTVVCDEETFARLLAGMPYEGVETG
ncbi:hypothetical protein [Frankia sp. AgKG'84/4]|uniref:hypothetical protein n=1 Tax=Frankia sp. AgKG'84/4 TaxID=573490 RepID=UPI00200BB37F|nr:hypothetical protein [Frankia sp. AgKG'84/4]MCL9793944.1 hypothetical protein [Frankia sp. AgKG'84/4]